MLIRRDGLMAQPYPNVNNFEKLLSTARTAAPAPGQMLNPLQQWEAMQKKYSDQERADLLSKAAAKSGESGEWVAQKMLQV